jgi:hypothetical protein
MERGRDTSDSATLSAGPSRGASLECRECQVICERVVSPWRCLRANHTCVYAFKDGDSTYFGCLHKVFSPELDLKAFKECNGGSAGKGDPYGPVRVVRAPRPQCPVSIERAYHVDLLREHCVNPGFLREVFRVVRVADCRPHDSVESDDDQTTS